MTLSFKGEVTRGQRFEKKLWQGLVFRLAPDESGWTVFLGNRTAPQSNYCAVETPPFHGTNSLNIWGRDFAKIQNSGKSQAGLRQILEPEQTRTFWFVLNAKDYRKAHDALGIILYRYNQPAERVKDADDAWGRITTGGGKLTVKEVRLSDHDIDGEPRIYYLKFEVMLRLPKEFMK
ncbi:MAG: hypothetical protein LAO31_06620 [Acidobacteriia bacterium]|nr:hypothetical protein [Terriglobia bacterium]